jgi:hypothetical protein
LLVTTTCTTSTTGAAYRDLRSTDQIVVIRARAAVATSEK